MNSDNNNNFIRRREGDIEDYTQLRHEIHINELDKRMKILECFALRAELPLEYIESVIKRNNERAEALKKITTNIVGWGIMGIMTWIGIIVTTIIWPAIMTKLKQYIGGF